MDGVTQPLLRPRRIAAGVGRALLNVALPIFLAWALVAAFYQYHQVGPHEVDGSPARYGPVRMRLKLPGTAEGIPEPILVLGQPGKAALVYVRLLRGAHAKVGVEFWGQAAVESAEFALPAADAVIDVSCYLPALFPPE